MTTIDRRHPRHRSSVVLPLVASVGSPWDDWGTVGLPAVGATVLDPDTVVLPVVAASLDAGPSRPAMRTRVVVPAPRPRPARVPDPRAASAFRIRVQPRVS